LSCLTAWHWFETEKKKRKTNKQTKNAIKNKLQLNGRLHCVFFVQNILFWTLAEVVSLNARVNRQLCQEDKLNLIKSLLGIKITNKN
jgi:hypothetical protein